MKRKTLQITLISILVIIAIGFGVGVGYLAYIIKTAPDISQLAQIKSSEASTIYSADGEVLTNLYTENRIYVPLSEIPMDLQNALIANEDQKFWEHNGINIWGILRALYVDIITWSKAQGASTITQQLARNVALTQKKAFSRKIQEIYLAIQLERMYTKEEILEMYLNEAFFGHSALGVQTAAQQYFGKDVKDLTLAESALLIGILPSPNRWSPYRNPETAKTRRALVLNNMVAEGYISEARAERSKKEPLTLAGLNRDTNEDFAPYFLRYVRDHLIDEFGSDTVYQGGLKVYTTLDPKMQEAAEQSLQKAIDPETGYLPTLERDGTDSKIQPQMAVISIDPRTGYIRAMVGGRGDDQFNRATQSLRQPGSAFKPLVYAAALEKGYSPGDVIDDIPGYLDPGNPNPWPINYNDKYEGPVSLRYALAHSINVASVRLLKELGVNTGIELAERLQFSSIVKEGSINDRNLGFALGGLTNGVSPIELASAYGTFANKGVYVEPIAITKVIDSDGHVLFEADPEKKIIFNEDIAYQMTSMLRSVVTSGTGWRAAIKGRYVSGKTGTTSDYRDAWFVGFIPDLVTAVWIGEDSHKAMIYDERDEEGNLLFSKGGAPYKLSSGEAARLWGEYMNQAVEGKPILEFERPANIINETIDPVTGKLPNEYTPKTVEEIYREGNEPTEIEQLHQPTINVAIDKSTGQLATTLCPSEQVIELTYQEATGVRVGPASFAFTVNLDGDDAGRRSYSYHFDSGVPIVQFDSKTGIPKTDQNGNFIYQYMPTVKCEEHAPDSVGEYIEEGGKKLIDNIWNFFNSGSNGD